MLSRRRGGPDNRRVVVAVAARRSASAGRRAENRSVISLTGRSQLSGKIEYIVRTKDLVKIFKLGDESLRALNGVSVDIRRGEYISIMGPSGSGKSTLFNAIGGLDKPDSGSVFINDVDMAQLDAGEL